MNTYYTILSRNKKGEGPESRATAFTFWYRRSEKETIAINLKKN
jgi:hypothetical protein